MKKILVIDDQQDNLIVIKALLRNYMPECEVFTAISGKLGIDIAKREQPDTIILDIIMPGMDGYEVCRILKSHESTKHIPIIMLTAIKTDTESRIKGLDSGADAFFSKPIEPSELSAQIHVMLRLKQVEDALRMEKMNLEKMVRERTKELWESEERYRSLMNDALDTSSVGVFILNRELKVEWINKAAEDFFGLQREHVIGKDKRQLVASAIKNIFENPEEFMQKVYATYDNNTYVENFECHILPTENREERWLIHWSQPIKTGLYAGGRIEQYTDITARKQAEQRVRESKDYYQAIFENTGAATIILGADSTILSANERFLALSGFSRGEIIGKKRLIDFVQKKDIEMLKQQDAMRKEKSSTALHQYEFRFVDRNKTVKDILLTTKMIPGTQNTVASLLDITERRVIEKELQKMQKLESIGTLASGIAHDFNNILMGVFGNIAMAKMELPEHHPVLSFLTEAEKSMERARRLTSQLLTFAKGGDPIKEDVCLIDLVKEIIEFDLVGSKIKPVFQYDDNLWTARIDKGQIEQVFSNLAINAKEAMPDGGHLYITLENVEMSDNLLPGLSSGKYIKVTVHDEGIGIPESHLDQIFDPYFTTKQTGNGLGLATVYSIIHKHHGYIHVDSAVDQGTTMTIYLPASYVQTARKEEKPDTDSVSSKRSARVLVMDDEKAIREVVSVLLKKVGFSVEAVEDGAQVIERYREAMERNEPFDVVIMDLTIPGGMGGKEAIKSLLTLDPGAKAIVSSGYTDDPIMANYTEYGFKGVAVKPYTITKLRETLDSVLQSE